MKASRFAIFKPNQLNIVNFLYACTIFLSAFLLFQVQPVIGKMILPWFGGSAAVWSACLLFFQALLLLGYLYAHLTTRYLTPRKQSLVHVSLLAASIATLPIMPNVAWKPNGSEDPTLLIIGLLAVSIGLPYFLLSTTGPLVQAWFARERPGSVPYRLFALSNFGSMLGLLSYPLAIEPRLTLRLQSISWSVAYIGFALICAALASRALATNKSMQVREEVMTGNSPKVGTLAFWIGLATCPTIFMMAVASHMTKDVAPIPLLWVLPLGLYLLSFILCFEGKAWYRRAWYLPLLSLALGGMCYVMTADPDLKVQVVIGLYCAGLFISCMVCHGELANLKPNPQYLTSFYLMISIGGAIGGILVAVIAPHFFVGDYELPIAMVATALLILITIYRDSSFRFFRVSGKKIGIAMSLLVAAMCVSLAYGASELIKESRLMKRNFYGILRVSDGEENDESLRTLYNGTIVHGEQFLASERKEWPTTYYGESTGVGMAIKANRNNGSQRVGVIGLGAGTMAAYGRSGDKYTFYEINPLVEQIAQSEFTFMSDSLAKSEVILGDARLSLEKEPSQNFDVLVVDAFSGDSIPVHLLTREAFAIYFRHLKPGGILAVHVSNRYLNLVPVVKLAADYYSKEARLVDSDEDNDKDISLASWVLVTDNADVFNDVQFKGVAEAIDEKPTIGLWTDDYSSIYPILE